jgi:hypothetical protein
VRIPNIVWIILFAIFISGCSTATPVPTLGVTATNSAIPITSTPLLTSTYTEVPTRTQRPTRTAVPTLAPTPIPTPGPDMALWYLDMKPLDKGVIEGQIYKYDLQTWSSTLAEIPNNEGIRRAAMSGDGKWLAYATEYELTLFNITLNRVEYKFPILSRLDVSVRPLIFSEDGQLLAFDDVNGLNIINIRSGSNWRFLFNRMSYDDTDWTHYWPRQFSADNSGLLVVVGKWEDSWLALVDILTKTIYRLDGCGFADGEWLDNNHLVTTVIHTEYTGCGKDEGVHLVDASANSVVDKRIYFEDDTEYLYGDNGPRDIQPSPNGDAVIFVQDTSDESGDRVQSKLMLLLLEDLQAIKILSITEEEIISPIWSNDMEVIYYAQLGKGAGVYRVDIASAEVTQLASLNSIESIYPISSDGNWLAISQGSDRNTDLKFLNLMTGTVVSITDLGAAEFLGWE